MSHKNHFQRDLAAECVARAVNLGGYSGASKDKIHRGPSFLSYWRERHKKVRIPRIELQRRMAERFELSSVWVARHIVEKLETGILFTRRTPPEEVKTQPYFNMAHFCCCTLNVSASDLSMWCNYLSRAGEREDYCVVVDPERLCNSLEP